MTKREANVDEVCETVRLYIFKNTAYMTKLSFRSVPKSACLGKVSDLQIQIVDKPIPE